MDLTKIEEEIKKRIALSSNPSAPEYRCSECKDSGWIDFTDENGSRFVKKCSCRIAREAEERLKVSGLADALKEQNFDSFRTDTPLQQHMKDVAEDYLKCLFDDQNSKRRPWLYVGGNPGAGKTHICTAVCGEILKHNIGVRYMQWLNEAPKLKVCAYDEHFEEYASEFIHPSVLYIDDLLKQKYTDDPRFTDADIRVAFTILNARYLMNKPTIISSEWDLIDQLLSADEGVFSRVYERCKEHTIRISRDQRHNYRMREGAV